MSGIADLLAIVNSNPNQTLDELIKEIDNKKRFVPSADTVLVAGSSVMVETENIDYNILNFMPELDGSVILKKTCDFNYCHFKIYKNGILISDVKQSAGTQNETLNVEKGNTYLIKCYKPQWSSNKTATASIYGDVKIIGYYSGGAL